MTKTEAKNLKRNDKVVAHGVELRVGHQNQGISWLFPVKDDRDWFLFKGLAVMKVMPTGEIKELYAWG